MKDRNMESEPFRRYTSLLLERDSLERDAGALQTQYLAQFGDLINENYSIKIACIEKKKAIAFCQMQINRGEDVDEQALHAYLENVMGDYKAQLKQMLESTDQAKKAGQVTEYKSHRAKKLYRHIAKLIHPDINPLTQEHERLQVLWTSAVIAYHKLDPERLEQIEAMVTRTLTELGEQGQAILEKGASEIFGRILEKIDAKIAKTEEEIENIRTTDPYQYKFLLEDPEAVNEKQAEFLREKEEYSKYAEELDKLLESLKAADSLGRRKGRSWRNR